MNNSSAQGQAGSGGGQSKSAMIKEGWGSKNNFAASYGYKPTPDGYQVANRLADVFMQADRASGQSGGKK